MRCKDIGRGDLRVLRSGQLSTSPCCRLAVRKGFAPRYPDCHPPGRSLDGDCVKRFLLRYASSVQHRRASSCFELLRASKTRRSSRNPSASRSLCAPSYGLVPFGARGPETSPRACCKKLRIVRSCRSSCIGGRRFGSCPQMSRWLRERISRWMAPRACAVSRPGICRRCDNVRLKLSHVRVRIATASPSHPSTRS